MCDECHQSPHATMCPNGTPMVDAIYVDCALCGSKVDEETTTYGICEKCWTDAHTLINARLYGERARESVSLNGFFVKLLTPSLINNIIFNAVLDDLLRPNESTMKIIDEFLRDDDGDFADWLKEQKGKE